ncbi:MAG TPA: hypothetical protein VK690_07000 [Stellaceae bacterium]|jgi:hypothetical protein|nr:hypothetical protein [Stellaceae bacterium]
MMILDDQPSRFSRAARTVALALALLWLAACGDVHGSANGAADDHGAVQRIRIGVPF